MHIERDEEQFVQFLQPFTVNFWWWLAVNQVDFSWNTRVISKKWFLRTPCISIYEGVTLALLEQSIWLLHYKYNNSVCSMPFPFSRCYLESPKCQYFIWIFKKMQRPFVAKRIYESALTFSYLLLDMDWHSSYITSKINQRELKATKHSKWLYQSSSAKCWFKARSHSCHNKHFSILLNCLIVRIGCMSYSSLKKQINRHWVTPMKGNLFYCSWVILSKLRF